MVDSSFIWGVTEKETAAVYPGDGIMPEIDHICFRAVSVNAPAQILFRWLCQMKLAPYSYDWIDNLGRQSPRQLVRGSEKLEKGQRVMTIFRLEEFKEKSHMVIVMDSPAAVMCFGKIVVSYNVLPVDESNCRLVVKLHVKYPGGAIGFFMRRFLPWGDLIMMKKQLLTFKWLAERDAKEASG